MCKCRPLLVVATVVALVAPAGAGERSPAETSTGERTESSIVTGTRQEILDRALVESGVTADWSDRKFANETIEIDRDARLEQIIDRALSRANFIVAYDMDGRKKRITRVLVLGRGLPASGTAELNTKIAAQRQKRRASLQVDEETRERLQHVHAEMLKRRQELAAAVAERSAALGGGAALLRTQAVSRVPLTDASPQTGNLPVVPGPGRRR